VRTQNTAGPITYPRHEWNATIRDIPQTTVPEWFEQKVHATPQAPAVRSGATELTYAELNARANRLARRLLSHGVGPERIVGVLLPRSDLLVTAIIAILKTGGTYMPLDPDLPADRIATMIDDAGPTVILAKADLTDGLPEQIAVPRLLLDRDTSTDSTDQMIEAGDLLATERHGPLTADTPVYLLYTSGSTGRPKGVLMCATAVINLLAWNLSELPSGPGRITVQYAAPGFDPSIQEVLATLLSGGSLVIPPDAIRRDPTALIDWLDAHGATDLFAPNTTVQALCRAAQERGRPLAALSHIAQGGEPFALTEQVRSFHRAGLGRTMHNLYGPTETHAATAHLIDGDAESWPQISPIGRPIWNTRVYVMDDALQPLPPGFPGELCIAGECLARGYHAQPGLTAERFLPDPVGPPGSRMYRTGDIARWRADGVLEYLGRADDQVKIRGVRIELGDVEAAIRRIPEVRDVAVIAAGEGGRRHLAAYLVSEPGAVDLADLAGHVRGRLAGMLPAAMIPASFTVVGSLPVNANGKVDRRALLTLRSEPTATGLGGEAPRTDEERALCGVVSQVLMVSEVGVHHSFFELGGDSLRAAELARRIRDEFKVELGPGDILSNPTVAELAARVRAATRPFAYPARLRPSPVPASYAQQSLWVIDRFEGPSARYNEPLAIRLRGQVDVAVLRRALTDVIARHEVLRTLIETGDGTPCQRILPADRAVPELTEVDVAAADLPQAMRRAAQKPFHLDAALPIRGWLFHLGGDELADDEHVLLVVMHHTACDGASIGAFWRDFATAYNARKASDTPQWTRLPLQYADYALWQRARFDQERDPSGIVRRQSDFWASTLAGLPQVMPLPTSRPRTDVRGASGGRVMLSVDSGLHTKLAALARHKRTTVFTVVHAAVVALLARMGAGPDVVIGTVVSGRTDREVIDLIGFFANTVVLRVDASGDPCLTDLVDRARDADLAAFAHQDLPFEHVVDLVGPVRSMAYSPLFQVMLAFQVPSQPLPPMTGLTAQAEPFDPGIAKFDLCFDVVERFCDSGAPAGLGGHIGYADDIFDQETVEHMRAELMQLLEEAAVEPDRIRAQRVVVVKAGTSSVVTAGRPDPGKLDRLCDGVHQAIRAGLAPVLVTSGAIAVGRARHAGCLAGAGQAAHQVAAALGQGDLYAALQERFAARGLQTGQLLLTPADLIEDGRHVGALATVRAMLALGLVPIINENDVLGVRNNDVLAAILSGCLGAELLLLLTDVPGLRDGAAYIPCVSRITPQLERLAAGAGEAGGTGGMLAKLSACWIATYSGVRAVIADAGIADVVLAAHRGHAVGTVFTARCGPAAVTDMGRLWRAFRTPPVGCVVLTPAGVAAVQRGRPVRSDHVIETRGTFGAGDVVDLATADGDILARGGIRCAATTVTTDNALFDEHDYLKITKE